MFFSSDRGSGCLNLGGEEELSNLFIVRVGRRNDTGIHSRIPDVLS
jgi:hypothetical protein